MSLSSAEIVTVPVARRLTRRDRQHLVRAQLEVSPGTAGETAVADTVSVTVSLVARSNVAVTVLSPPPSSEIDVGSNFNVTVGAVSVVRDRQRLRRRAPPVPSAPTSPRPIPSTPWRVRGRAASFRRDDQAAPGRLLRMERAAARDTVDGGDGADHDQYGGETKRCREPASTGVHEA